MNSGLARYIHGWSIKSQNGWVGRDLKAHSVPSPCHGQGHFPLAQSFQCGYKHFQGCDTGLTSSLCSQPARSDRLWSCGLEGAGGMWLRGTRVVLTAGSSSRLPPAAGAAAPQVPPPGLGGRGARAEGPHCGAGLAPEQREMGRGLQSPFFPWLLSSRTWGQPLLLFLSVWCAPVPIIRDFPPGLLTTSPPGTQTPALCGSSMA